MTKDDLPPDYDYAIVDNAANIAMGIDAAQNVTFAENAFPSMRMLTADKRWIDIDDILAAARDVISARRDSPYEIAFLYEAVDSLEQALKGTPNVGNDTEA